MDPEKQDLFNSICEGLGIAPPTQGQMDDFILALDKNGLKLLEKCCEPFEPCEKCAKKTVWKPISEMSGIKVKHWILDKDNNVGVGFLDNDDLIKFDMFKTPIEFGTPTMFTEIKPPESPCN